MNRKIHVSVESIMVILLMIVFAISISILIFHGSVTYRNIIDGKTEEENIRIALSYVNMRIKQNDIAHNILIDEDAFNGEDLLTIYHSDEEDGLHSYIYYKDGYLWECYTDGDLDHSLSTEIIAIKGIEFALEEENKILTTVHYRNNDYYIPLTQLTVLRTTPNQ